VGRVRGVAAGVRPVDAAAVRHVHRAHADHHHLLVVRGRQRAGHPQVEGDDATVGRAEPGARLPHQPRQVVVPVDVGAEPAEVRDADRVPDHDPHLDPCLHQPQDQAGGGLVDVGRLRHRPRAGAPGVRLGQVAQGVQSPPGQVHVSALSRGQPGRLADGGLQVLDHRRERLVPPDERGDRAALVPGRQPALLAVGHRGPVTPGTPAPSGNAERRGIGGERQQPPLRVRGGGHWPLLLLA
jgi:hypothetical protein